MIGIFSVSIEMGIVIVIHLTTTISAAECEAYCIERTNRGATDFVCFGDGRYVEDYTYWVAADGDSTKAQEIFIFKQKLFGLLNFNRYQFIASNTQVLSDNNKVGSIRFFTRNDDGKKEKASTLLFYGAVADSDIKRYEFSLTIAQGTNTYAGTIKANNGAWLVKFCDVQSIDENTKKDISNVKFFNSKDEIILTY